MDLESIGSSEESIELLERLPLLVCRLSPHGQILYANTYVGKVSGYDAKELQGSNWWDLFYPGEYRFQVDELYELFQEGDVIDHEMVFVDKAGQEHTIKWTSYNEFKEEGDLEEIIGLGLDISGKVEAEKAARRERMAFAKITEISPVAITIVERDGRISYANEKAIDVLGLTKSEIRKRMYNDPQWRITDLDGKPMPDDELPIRRVLREKKPIHGVKHAIHLPNGGHRFLSINSAPFFNNRGEVERIVNSIEDITERVEAKRASERALRALKVTNEGLRSLMNADTIEEYLEEICDIAVNIGGYALAWFGLANQDESKSVDTIAISSKGAAYIDEIEITWDDSPLGMGPTGMAIKNQTAVKTEDIQYETDYSPWRNTALKHGFRSSIAIPFVFDSNEMGVFNVYSNERNAFDEAEIALFEKLIQSLEFAIQAKRLEIQHRNTREQLEKVSAQAFLYMDVMAHDLRNHLQSVTLGLELLSTEYPQISKSVAMETLDLQIDRATRLIQKASTLNKVLSTDIEHKSLNKSMEEAMLQIGRRYPGIQIEFDAPSTDCIVQGNDYLTKAFYDILENAVEHNPSEQIKIWIEVSRGDEYCEVTIADNGKGVPDELKGSLFDHQRRFGGFGLHLVANIIERYGGRVEVTDRIPRAPTEGAKFLLRIPLA
jgi:PAS domain S-box-containing protein